MIGYIIRKFIGTKNEREVKKMRPIVAQVNEIEASLQNLSEEALRQKATELKARLSQITDNEELARELNTALPEAYAMVKNACRRLVGRDISVRGHPLRWDMVPFDVQIIGGIALHSGKIAEMATGEGKTLVATFPVFLNALTGRGVHVVTVNDYLAARDSEWMGAVYRLLGLTVGCILHDQSPETRRAQYNADITYGTNAEFGFDYLRDNGMATRVEEQVQRGHYFAIIDEVDSILIDEARVPLIISGPAVVHQDSKYGELKPAIEGVVRNQERLCNRFVSEAEALIKKLADNDPSAINNRQATEDEIGTLLYRVKLGQPKSAALMRLLEDPENLRRVNKVDLELHADQSKKALYREKEELFFAIEEKSHEADLTEKGRAFLSPNDPDAFVLPDLITAYHEIDAQAGVDLKERMQQKAKVQQHFENRAEQIHSISQLLKAYCIYQKDVQYVVQDNKVIIVDENTGRLMVGRRWSEGLHQAVEAKEGVEIERETQTFATITIQNYFRMYAKLAGMTGTAETEAGEFWDIYKLGVMVIPTNRPVSRKDKHDTVYKTRREKYIAAINEIKAVHAEGRPILVGTISVEVSEQLSKMLNKAGIVHNVLNAKQHEREAEVVSLAGQKGSVTIATNMAGRGTDIKLGQGIADRGGLHVVATERHESRRIDRQLRGRCARQGDPGSSHFFVSLEDDLMRLFGSDRIVKIMERVGLEEGQELEHPLLNRSIETAQKRVEQHNFQIRKRTLEYDDVMNKQREVIYGFRNEIMRSEDVRDRLMDVMEEVVLQKISQHTTGDAQPEDWDLRALTDWVNLNFVLAITEEEIQKIANGATEQPVEDSIYDGLSPAQFAACVFIQDQIREAYKIKISYENPDVLARIERYTILSAIDKLWQEHLYNMDSLRHSIGLRSYGQRDPLIEYKGDAFKMFEELMVSIKSEICHNIFRSASSLMAFEQFLANLPKRLQQAEISAFGQGQSTIANGPTGSSDVVSEVSDEVAKAKPVRTGPKVGRNDACPCGSGKKFKSCCGKTL